MKLTVNLPARKPYVDPLKTTVEIDKVKSCVAGVIMGFNFLPEKIQHLVEWVGVELYTSDPLLGVKVEIKIKKEIISQLSQAHITPIAAFFVQEFNSETEHKVGDDFQKTINEMIEKLAECLQRIGSDLLK